MNFLIYILSLVVGIVVIIESEKLLFKIDSLKVKVNLGNRYMDIALYMVFLTYIYSFYSPSEGVTFIVLYILLYLVALIDKEKGIIPDKYVVSIILIGVLNVIGRNIKISEILISVLPIILILSTVLIVEKITDSEVMGGGDIKLLFALSIVMGIENIMALLFLSNLYFLLRDKSNKIVPFAPYIFMGYLTTFPLVRLYYKLIFM